MLPDCAQLIMPLSIPGCEISDLKHDFVLFDKTAINLLVFYATLTSDEQQR